MSACHRGNPRSARPEALPAAGEAAPDIAVSMLTPERPLEIRTHPDSRRLRSPGADIHLWLELGVILAGAVRRNHGAGWFLVRPGQAWVCGSLEPHRWDYGRGRCAQLIVHFLPSLLTQMPCLPGFDPGAVFRSSLRLGAIGVDRAFRQTLLSVARELAPRYEEPAWRSVLPGPAWLDLVRLLGVISPQMPATAPATLDNVFAASRLLPVMNQLQHSSPRRLNIRQAAQMCHMGRSTFRRHFAQVTGQAFSTFERRLRLSRAAHALRCTPSPLKAVAARFGFTDASHFVHSFVAHYGMTPGTYRRLFQGPAGG